jgi:hypothetical protein
MEWHAIYIYIGDGETRQSSSNIIRASDSSIVFLPIGTSSLPWSVTRSCSLPCFKAGLAIGMDAGMVLVLCIQTAKHRIVNAHLVVLTKGRAAALLGTGRRPCGCILQVLL